MSKRRNHEKAVLSNSVTLH